MSLALLASVLFIMPVVWSMKIGENEWVKQHEHIITSNLSALLQEPHANNGKVTFLLHLLHLENAILRWNWKLHMVLSKLVLLSKCYYPRRILFQAVLLAFFSNGNAPFLQRLFLHFRLCLAFVNTFLNSSTWIFVRDLVLINSSRPWSKMFWTATLTVEFSWPPFCFRRLFMREIAQK